MVFTYILVTIRYILNMPFLIICMPLNRHDPRHFPSDLLRHSPSHKSLTTILTLAVEKDKSCNEVTAAPSPEAIYSTC
jgi:hypothetical protein